MKKHVLTSFLILSVAAGSAAEAAKLNPAAKPTTAYSVSIQSVGTFDSIKPENKIAITLSPEESEPASFVVKPSKAATGLTVKLSGALVSGKNQISADKVSFYSVSGNRLDKIAPSDVQSGESKRFWMSVSVPAKMAGGVYKSSVTAVADGKTVGTIPVEVTVLPMRLLTSCKQYGVILPTATAVDEDYKKTLKAVRASGFGLASTAVAPDELSDALAAIKDAGLGSTVPYTYPDIASNNVGQIKEIVGRSSQVLCCSAYEPKTSEQISEASERIAAVHDARLKSFAVLADPVAFEQLAGSLDAMTCNISLPYVQQLIATGKRTAPRKEWMYWDVTENAKTNRLNAGYILWKSWMDGAYLPLSGDAAINTIEWEALREGADDTRYITTLMSVIREAKDLHKCKDVTDEAEAYLASALAKPLSSMSNSDYQAIRLKLANYTIKLRATVKP